MTLTVFLIAYNEAIMLPYTIAHYRSRFPGCRIVVYDNFSEDITADIAIAAGCEVRDFWTDNKMDDQALVNVKNNCWKGEQGWVIVCDVDELLDATYKDLSGCTVFDSEVIDMIGNQGDPERVRLGVSYPHCPRKMTCFHAPSVESMNYGFGAHTAMPIGHISISTGLKIYHYKYLSPEYIIARNAAIGARLSPSNKRLGLSFHYLFGKRKVRRIFRRLRKMATLQTFSLTQSK